MKWISETRARLGAWNDARKEKAAERKARKPPAPHGAAPLIWIWFLSFIAVATLIGSTWMLMVFIAGSVGSVDWGFDWRAGNDGEPSRWTWFAQAQIHLLVGIGLLCFCLGIAAFNAVWLHVRTHLHGLFRAVVTTLGVLVALFMISGAIVVQQWGTVARERDEIVATNTARQGVATVQAEIDAIETEMARLCAPNLTTWQAQACRSGTAAWTRRIEIARTQRADNFDIIERAIADAEQGDTWRARLVTLRQQAAVARVDTVEAEAQQVEVVGWMSQFTRWLEDVRKPFIAVLGELLAMTMFGVALAAALSRRQTVEQSGWAPEGRRIEDLRAEEPIARNPVKVQTQVRATNAETGEEEVLVKPRPYWRRARRGVPTRVEVSPEVPPDETGVAHDGGNRAGSVTAGPPVDESDHARSASKEAEPSAIEPVVEVDVADSAVAEVHPESSDIPEDEEQAYREVYPELFADAHGVDGAAESSERATQHADEERAAVEADALEHDIPDENGESEQEQDHTDLPENEDADETEEEPQFDEHVRARALIAAE